MANHAHSMSAPDRRLILGGVFALSAMAAAPAKAAHPDHELFQIENRLDMIQPELERRRAIEGQRLEAAHAAWEAAGRPMATPQNPMQGLIEFERTHGVYDDDCDDEDLGREVMGLFGRAAEIPAQTLEGLRVKTAIALWAYFPNDDTREVTDLFRDLVRLTGVADGRDWLAWDLARLAP